MQNRDYQKLRNCPFCGGEAKVMACDGAGCYFSNLGTAYFMGRPLDHLLIRCGKCGMRTKSYSTERGAIKVWNRRADNG